MILSMSQSFRFFPAVAMNFEYARIRSAAVAACALVAAVLVPAVLTAGQGGTSPPDEVRATFDKLCSKCHTLALAAKKAGKLGDSPALRKAVAEMMKKGGLAEPSGAEAEAMAVWLLAEAGIRRMPAGLEVGKSLFELRCSLCHKADYAERAATKLKSSSEWSDIVKKERARDTAAFTEEEAVQIVKFLEWAFPPPSSEEEKAILRVAIVKKCRLCHDLPLDDLEPRLPGDWDVTVELMRRLNPFNIGADEVAPIASYFKENYALRPKDDEELARAETALFFKKKCSLCHSLALARNRDQYFESWEIEVERMRLKSPSIYTRAEGARIAAYLSGKR
jgi:mono/diheme cytochrome c family protein